MSYRHGGHHKCYKTNDGTRVNTRDALAMWKGAYKNGQITERLYLHSNGFYYLVSHTEGTCEWCCSELAIEWFKANVVWDLPKNLIEEVV